MAHVLHKRFGYCFATPPGSEYPPILNEHRIQPGVEVSLHGAGGEIRALPVDLVHGSINALGFRFGDIAYTPDVNHILPETAAMLHGLDVWIIDALRYTPHPSHFSLDDALGWIAALKPRRAILTNLHNDLDYDVLRARLPAHIIPAFDGLSFVEGGDLP
jgi:phosphoribosyl 1,2-cyclic phosphate phosphodiesterase